jgi:alpha-L-fucosidase
MDWWRKARFGMFIHWGVYSVPAGVYHGEPHDGLGEWLMQDAHIPRAEYAQFAKQFNPTAYDPEQWVLLAKAAGMKYIVITAKHHDGFALFGSQASSWNIVDASPYGKDLLRPLVDACRKNGMKIGFYYSQANDWYNPGGAAAYGHWDSTQTSQGMDAYLDRVVVPQLKDLLTKYGDVAELWFDVPTDMTPERAAKIKRLLGLQPNMIINDRLGGDVAGDITTPEQYVPATGITGRDWETCMTINDTWGFKKYDSNWKSTQLLVHNLVDAASKGGNYLLNVGPDDEGRLPAAIVDRLKGVGAWMDRHSEAIYATTASPFAYLPWGRCTVKADAKTTTLYFFVFHWPSTGKLLVPGLANSVATAELPARTSPEGLVLTVPERPTDPLLPVIKVVVNGPVRTPEYVVRPEALSVFNLLPELATIHNAGDGQGARVEGGDITNIGFWTNEESTASWKIEVPETGAYNMWIKMATTADVSNFDIEIGDQKMPCWVSTTGGYENYREVQFGQVKLTAGEHTVRIVPRKGYWKPINVRKLLLTTAAGAGEVLGQAGQAGE